MKLPEYKSKWQAEQYAPMSQPKSYNYIVKKKKDIHPIALILHSLCTFRTSFALYHTSMTARILTFNHIRITIYN